MLLLRDAPEGLTSRIASTALQPASADVDVGALVLEFSTATSVVVRPFGEFDDPVLTVDLFADGGLVARMLECLKSLDETA